MWYSHDHIFSKHSILSHSPMRSRIESIIYELNNYVNDKWWWEIRFYFMIDNVMRGSLKKSHEWKHSIIVWYPFNRQCHQSGISCVRIFFFSFFWLFWFFVQIEQIMHLNDNCVRILLMVCIPYWVFNIIDFFIFFVWVRAIFHSINWNGWK